MTVPRKARVYDRLVGGEGLEGPKRRFAEVDAATEALRPGAIVALATDCDELLAAQRGDGGWSLTTICTEWSSRGETGWHTHAGDYAVESLEPHCLFRVVREGPRIIFASIAADGKMLCACSSGNDRDGAVSLGLASCSAGAWVAAGASWEQQDGELCNSRWPDKVLPMRLLHVTCLPTMQLQRVEEFYGGLLHEVVAEKSTAEKRVRELEAERNAAAMDILRLRQQVERQQAEFQKLQQQQPAAQAAPPAREVVGLQPDVTVQLATLQKQLETLNTDGQERARMSIAIRTIKEITDLVRQSAAPSTVSSPSLAGLPAGRSPATTRAGTARPTPDSPPALAPATQQEDENRQEVSRLPVVEDYLGSRPEEADPLDRVLDVMPLPADSPPNRLRRLSNSGSISSSLESPVSGSLKSTPPLCESVSLAVKALGAASPRQADGVAQYLATGPMPLRASQQLPMQQQGGGGSKPLRHRNSRLRSSFLQRPPAAAADLYSF